MTRIFRRLRRLGVDERGAALAELAIMVPFLVVMVAAVTELGRFFQTYSTLAKSTRAASRYLSNVANEEPYLTRAKNIGYCGKVNCEGADPVVSGLDPDDVELSIVYSEGGAGPPETVTVSINNYSFAPLFDIGALLNDDTFSLALPVRPSNTMFYMWTESAGAEEGG